MHTEKRCLQVHASFHYLIRPEISAETHQRVYRVPRTVLCYYIHASRVSMVKSRDPRVQFHMSAQQCRPYNLDTVSARFTTLANWIGARMVDHLDCCVCQICSKDGCCPLQPSLQHSPSSGCLQ